MVRCDVLADGNGDPAFLYCFRYSCLAEYDVGSLFGHFILDDPP